MVPVTQPGAAVNHVVSCLSDGSERCEPGHECKAQRPVCCTHHADSAEKLAESECSCNGTQSDRGGGALTSRRLKLSSTTLLAANLVPLAGVLLWQWSVSSVIVLYWFENIVIGVINVARMITFSPADQSLAAAIGVPKAEGAVLSQGLHGINARVLAHGFKLFLIPFFVLHYFMFCAGHGIFVFGFFEDEAGYFSETIDMGLLDSLGRAIEIFSTPLALAAVILAASHAVSFFVNYLGGGEYKHVDIRRLMMMPYGRVVVLHVTIIFGGFATMALGEPIWLVVILVLVKMAVDLKMHVKEHGADQS